MWRVRLGAACLPASPFLHQIHFNCLLFPFLLLFISPNINNQTNILPLAWTCTPYLAGSVVWLVWPLSCSSCPRSSRYWSPPAQDVRNSPKRASGLLASLAEYHLDLQESYVSGKEAAYLAKVSGGGAGSDILGIRSLVCLPHLLPTFVTCTPDLTWLECLPAFWDSLCS